MARLRLSLLADGQIWQLLELFRRLREEAVGEGKKAELGLISSLVQHTANVSDEDIWWRGTHSSLQPRPCSPDCFRQRAHVVKQRMQRWHAGGEETGEGDPEPFQRHAWPPSGCIPDVFCNVSGSHQAD